MHASCLLLLPDHHIALRRTSQTLGIRRTATAEQIKRAYKRLALQLHPDKNPHESAAEQFIRVQRSHEVLSDPALRRRYDTTGSVDDNAAQQQQQQQQWQRYGQGRGGAGGFYYHPQSPHSLFRARLEKYYASPSRFPPAVVRLRGESFPALVARAPHPTDTTFWLFFLFSDNCPACASVETAFLTAVAALPAVARFAAIHGDFEAPFCTQVLKVSRVPALLGVTVSPEGEVAVVAPALSIPLGMAPAASALGVEIVREMMAAATASDGRGGIIELLHTANVRAHGHSGGSAHGQYAGYGTGGFTSQVPMSHAALAANIRTVFDFAPVPAAAYAAHPSTFTKTNINNHNNKHDRNKRGAAAESELNDAVGGTAPPLLSLGAVGQSLGARLNTHVWNTLAKYAHQNT